MERNSESDYIFHKYDVFGREILSGLYHLTSSGTGSSMYNIQENYKKYVLTESVSSTASNFYYTWAVFPELNDVYYGGNVSALTWKATEPTTAVRGYSFTYDALRQLSSASYGEGTTLNTNTSRYDESFTYDKHGNVKTLKRYGLKDNNTFGLIDNAFA